MIRTYSEEFTTVGKDVGKLDASNSFGAVVGTFAAGFLMIPILGIQNSIIVTEPSDSYHNNGILFTKEYFSLLSNRLTENGLVSQWVPAWKLPGKNFMIFYNTFHSVFPYVYVYYMEPDNISQLIFIGSQKPIEIGNNELYLFNHEDLNEIETELNTDDKPIIEFATALNLYSPDTTTVIIPSKEDVLEILN